MENDRKLSDRTKLTPTDISELLQFVLTTTYFSFNDCIYQQRFGTAMGSPVSPVVANLFMEHLEREAIATAPIDIRPRIWKRYVDDILEIVKKNVTPRLTEHLNSVDRTGSIQFTYEEEKENTIPFLDTLLVKKPSGEVKILVFRKETHTDQYLNFTSEHPLHHKLGVIRTLFNRCDSVITEDADKVKERDAIEKALTVCGYPRWTFRKVNNSINQRAANTRKSKKSDKKDNNRGMVVLPYIKGVSETLSRVFKKYGIASAMKPHLTIRNLLVHPKDKVDKNKKCGVVYNIPCLNCSQSYIGETGRQLEVRIKEHKEDVDKNTVGVGTRHRTRLSESEFHKSAVTDHAKVNKHVIDWKNVSILDSESNDKKRGIKEAIAIRKNASTMNRDEGRYNLSHTYDQLLRRHRGPRSITSRPVSARHLSEQ